jgi:hypothetical protein
LAIAYVPGKAKSRVLGVLAVGAVIGGAMTARGVIRLIDGARCSGAASDVEDASDVLFG